LAQIFPSWTNGFRRSPRSASAGFSRRGRVRLVLLTRIRILKSKQPVAYSHKVRRRPGHRLPLLPTSVETRPTPMYLDQIVHELPTMVKPDTRRWRWSKLLRGGSADQWVRCTILPIAFISIIRPMSTAGRLHKLSRQRDRDGKLRCRRRQHDGVSLPPESGLEPRPVDQVTNMKWEKPSDHTEWVARFKQEKNIKPPIACSGCHR
jgi:hypothetical protein